MKIIFARQIYKVSIKDWFYIVYQEVVLLLKRYKRRFNIIFPNKMLALNLFVTSLWIGYGFFVWIFGKSYVESDYSFLDVLWDIKEGYFTSVILTLIISAVGNIKEYKEKLVSQYYFYLETMNDFEMLFAHSLNDKLQHYMPFYCRNVLQVTLHELENSKDGADKLSNESLQTITQRIKVLQENIKNNKIILCDTASLMDDCNNAKDKIDDIYIKNKIDYEDVAEISDILYRIINRIRNPWRWDIGKKTKILTILNKYPENEVGEDFYYRMLLDDFSINNID